MSFFLTCTKNRTKMSTNYNNNIEFNIHNLEEKKSDDRKRQRAVEEEVNDQNAKQSKKRGGWTKNRELALGGFKHLEN